MGLFNFLFRKNKKNQRSEAIEITYENLAVMNEHDPNYIKDRVLQYRTEHIEMLVQKGEFGENFDMKKMKLVEKALKFIGEWDLDYYKQNGNNAYLHRIAGRTATLKGSVFDFFHMAYENKMNKESGLLLYECASLFAITKHELFFIHATKMSFYFYPLKEYQNALTEANQVINMFEKDNTDYSLETLQMAFETKIEASIKLRAFEGLKEFCEKEIENEKKTLGNTGVSYRLVRLYGHLSKIYEHLGESNNAILFSETSAKMEDEILQDARNRKWAQSLLKRAQDQISD